MTIDLPLDEMTVGEKLAAVEKIWASLCAKPTEVRSPSWHEVVLAERAERLKSGEATVSDWEDAKKRLQDLGR